MEYTVEAVFGRTSPGVHTQEKGHEGQLQVISEPLIETFRVRDTQEVIKCLVTNAALLSDLPHPIFFMFLPYFEKKIHKTHILKNNPHVFKVSF